MGIVLGLSLTFTITVVALASLVKGVGLAGNGVRVLAEVVLIVFGLALIVPGAAARLEAPLAGLSRFGPRSRGTGFWSGVGVGGALGFAYTPCAGPILAAVISVSASEGTSARLVTVAVAYAAGSAAVLLALALGGQWVGDRIKRAGHGLALQRSLGVVMIATAVALSTQLDVRFEKVLADNLPAFAIDPTHGLERSHAVATRLAGLRGKPRFGPDSAQAAAPKRSDGLQDYGPAPPFTDNQRWFNTPGGRPLTLAGLRGRVVLVDFWTYTCINCIRTLPHLEAWDARYRKDGLTIVGVHSPEFPFEHDAGNVQSAIQHRGDQVPGRAGQQPRHLERVRQPVLAGRVPDRRARARALRAFRRGRLRAGRARHPHAAGRGGGEAARVDHARARPGARRGWPRPRPTWGWLARRASSRRPCRGPSPTRRRRHS